MKPHWDRLAQVAHHSVFIADVNCSTETDLCDRAGVGGYPTIKVYKKDGKEVTDYQGGREFEELLEFVQTELAVQCNVHDATQTTCSTKAQAYVTKWQARDKETIAKEMDRLAGMENTSMAPDLKAWLRERISILAQL